MDTNEFSNFLIGLKVKVGEEMTSMGNKLNTLYEDILQKGTNNNSDIAIAVREATDSIFLLVEDLKSKV